MDLAIFNLIIGIVLLLFGRKLFWLFVGVAGFLAGMEIVTRYFAGSDQVRLLIALGVGILCAILAVLFYKVAAAIAGFLIGGYLAAQLLNYLGISLSQTTMWIPYLIGGIIGAILILLLLDWALILLSSFAGASLIVPSVNLQQINMTLVFVGLVIVGILVQAGFLLRSRQTAV